MFEGYMYLDEGDLYVLRRIYIEGYMCLGDLHVFWGIVCIKDYFYWWDLYIEEDLYVQKGMYIIFMTVLALQKYWLWVEFLAMFTVPKFNAAVMLHSELCRAFRVVLT